jgi:hypothetical protein
MTPVTTIEAPSVPEAAPHARTARVAVVRTRPETVLADYGRVMELAGYRDTLSRDRDTPHQTESLVDEVLPVLFVAAVAGRWCRRQDAGGWLFTQPPHPDRKQNRRYEPA